MALLWLTVSCTCTVHALLCIRPPQLILTEPLTAYLSKLAAKNFSYHMISWYCRAIICSLEDIFTSYPNHFTHNIKWTRFKVWLDLIIGSPPCIDLFFIVWACLGNRMTHCGSSTETLLLVALWVGGRDCRKRERIELKCLKGETFLLGNWRMNKEVSRLFRVTQTVEN